MWPPSTFIGMLSVGMMVLGADAAHAQNYPNKPIRIVTAGVGSAGDVASRVMADGLAGSLGQKLVVDNRSSGVIPVEIVAKSPADGYTLLLSGDDSIYINTETAYIRVDGNGDVDIEKYTPQQLTAQAKKKKPPR